MTKHLFYPPVELPDQVESYVSGLKNHHKEFGDVTGNSEKELKDVLARARDLQPISAEIEQLQLQLAKRLDEYHKAAGPLWTAFSERLGYARTFADKHDNPALASFLKAFRHNEGRHNAATGAEEKKPKE